MAEAAVLARVIAAIGKADFHSNAAAALTRAIAFDHATFFLHGTGAAAVPLHAGFQGRGVEAYAAHTFAHNPMLAQGRGVFRARDFFRPHAAQRPLLVPSPGEELGFRTDGWPEQLEEVGLYMPACGGIVELSFYRQRGRRAAARSVLRDLADFSAPLAAAFERHMALAAPSLDALSARERDVADLVLLGCTSRAIAARLGIGLHTVKGHRKAIFRKLGIASQRELFAARLPS